VLRREDPDKNPRSKPPSNRLGPEEFKFLRDPARKTSVQKRRIQADIVSKRFPSQAVVIKADASMYPVLCFPRNRIARPVQPANHAGISRSVQQVQTVVRVGLRPGTASSPCYRSGCNSGSAWGSLFRTDPQAGGWLPSSKAAKSIEVSPQLRRREGLNVGQGGFAARQELRSGATHRFHGACPFGPVIP
jgi:hypothetical protein